MTNDSFSSKAEIRCTASRVHPFEMAEYDPVYEQQNQVKKPFNVFRKVCLHPKGEK